LGAFSANDFFGRGQSASRRLPQRLDHTPHCSTMQSRAGRSPPVGALVRPQSSTVSAPGSSYSRQGRPADPLALADITRRALVGLPARRQTLGTRRRSGPASGLVATTRIGVVGSLAPRTGRRSRLSDVTLPA